MSDTKTINQFILEVSEHLQLALDRQQHKREKLINRGGSPLAIVAMDAGDRELRLIKKFVLNSLVEVAEK